jgi:hypothetical protein
MRQLALDGAFDWLTAADKGRDYDRMHNELKVAISQLNEKEALLARLNSEATQLLQHLTETGARLRLSEEHKQWLLEHPVRLAALSAKAVAKRCGRAVLRRKSA